MKTTKISKVSNGNRRKMPNEWHSFYLVKREIWFENEDRISKVSLLGIPLYIKRERDYLTVAASIPGYRT